MRHLSWRNSRCKIGTYMSRKKTQELANDPIASRHKEESFSESEGKAYTPKASEGACEKMSSPQPREDPAKSLSHKQGCGVAQQSKHLPCKQENQTLIPLSCPDTHVLPHTCEHTHTTQTYTWKDKKTGQMLFRPTNTLPQRIVQVSGKKRHFPNKFWKMSF